MKTALPLLNGRTARTLASITGLLIERQGSCASPLLPSETCQGQRNASAIPRGQNFFKARIALGAHIHYCARTMTEPWDIPAAISLYNIDRWGLGYFTVNAKGNVEVRPTQDAKT